MYSNQLNPRMQLGSLNDCCSAANSVTSTTSLIDLLTPLQSSITPLESAQLISLLPQSAHQPILAPFPKRTIASKHVPFVHLGTESTNGCIIKKEVTQYCVTIV